MSPKFQQDGILAYVEGCLPGDSPARRLDLARSLGLALEIACRDGRLPAALADCGLPVVTVQAWDLHHDHPLHPDPARRAAAARHVTAALESAARVGARGVVTVCAYGPEVADRPRQRCRDFFAALAPRARELGVRILIEPLSRQRAAAPAGPEAVQGLLDDLAAPGVFGAVLDTGHLLDDGHDPAAIIAGWHGPLDEIQLRGAGSAPPGPDEGIEDWLAAAPRLPPVVAIEHRQPISLDAWEALVARLRRIPGLPSH